MKKMIMFAASVMAAVVVQAASVSWSATDIQPATAGESVGSYVAYFVMDATSAEITAALEAGTIADIAAGSATVTPGSGRTKSKVSGTATTSHVEADGQFNGYLIVFNSDSSQYMMATKTGMVADMMSSADFTFGAQTSATWAANPGGGDVPEPTSGLLLLVGGAMLALRRKQK